MVNLSTWIYELVMHYKVRMVLLSIILICSGVDIASGAWNNAYTNALSPADVWELFTSGGGYSITSGGGCLAQSIEVPEGERLTKASFFIYDNSVDSNANIVTVQLFSGNFGSTALLAQKSYTADRFYIEQRLTVMLDVPQPAGTYYVQVYGNSPDYNTHLHGMLVQGSTYGDGRAAIGLNGSTLLGAEQDFMVRFYTTVIPDKRIIGNQKQLFMDDWILADRQNVVRQFGQPAKNPNNPIIARDKPWDVERADIYGTVVVDTDNNRLQGYYSAMSATAYDYRLAYAESYNGGQTWTKPVLDLVPFEGDPNTNIVLEPPCQHFMGPCVFRDGHETDPNKRYKMLTCSYYDKVPHSDVNGFYRTDWNAAPPAGMSKPGMYIAYSADGIHWNLVPESLSNLISDTAQCVFWDKRLGKYVAYVRGRVATKRAVGRMESIGDNFEAWTEPVIIMNESPQLYSMSVTPYEGIYIGLPWMCWDLSTDIPEKPVISPELAISRDGIDWYRCNEWEEFIPVGSPGSADSMMIRVGGSMAVFEDHVLFWYGQTNKAHTGNAGYEGGVATLRLDGFASLNAGSTVGTVTTFPLEYFDSDSLQLNVETEAGGFVYVELLDAKSMATLAQSLPVSGDWIAKDVLWRDNAVLKNYENMPVILKFRMRDAKLYAFQFKKR